MPNPLGGFDYTWPLYLGGVLAYLIGSIPFGLLLVRFAGLGDVRELGSGNIGATNVLRTGNKGLAAATLLLDGGKGVVAVLVANYFGPDMAVVAGGAVVVGHVFPVWLRFRGGKGVATALGTILAIAWPVGVLACAVWVLAAKFWRYSSLAGILAVTASPLFGWYLADPQRSELMFFLAVVVVVRHHANLRRLFKGEESKISLAKGEPGQRAGDPPDGTS